MEMPYDTNQPVQMIPCLDTARMPIGSCIKLDRYHSGELTNEYVGIVRYIEDSLQEFTLLYIDENQNEQELRISVTALYVNRTETGYTIDVLATPKKS